MLYFFYYYYQYSLLRTVISIGIHNVLPKAIQCNTQDSMKGVSSKKKVFLKCSMH